MEFFIGYNNIRCNHDEFQFIKKYLWEDGWSWYSNPDDYNPDDLALISVRDKDNKHIIPYYLDEIEYLVWEKDVKEIIREIKLKELGI
jgi:hypothetical protein